MLDLSGSPEDPTRPHGPAIPPRQISTSPSTAPAGPRTGPNQKPLGLPGRSHRRPPQPNSDQWPPPVRHKLRRPVCGPEALLQAGPSPIPLERPEPRKPQWAARGPIPSHAFRPASGLGSNHPASQVPSDGFHPAPGSPEFNAPGGCLTGRGIPPDRNSSRRIGTMAGPVLR